VSGLGPGLGLFAVLAASLLGSLHCVGMCGGFVAAVGNAGRGEGRRRSFGPLLAYQGARGLAYVGLGALAGLLGAGLEHGAALLGLQRFAAVAMGLVLIAMGLAALWPGRGLERDAAAPLVSLGGHPARRPSLLARLRLRLTRAVRERGATAGAAAGLLSALLPCGWLWAYVIVAAATGSAGYGALVMAVFWLGSVPALLGVGLLAGELGRRLGRHAPKLTAAAMLTLGLLSLAGKLTPTPQAEHLHPTGDESPAQIEAGGETEAEPPALPTDAPCH
jgi:sulfite exporter TauE/SafE